MELIVLGSGAFAPARRGLVRNPSGYAVRVGGRLLIFDLGFGNVRQLARAGLDPADVTDVFLSHRHPDHCGDLAALLFMLRYDVKPKSGVLRVWGPRGFRKFWKDLARAYRPWLDPSGYRLEVKELASGAKVTGRGWEVACLGVPHPTPALAYKLLYKDKSLVYSGDTGFSPRLADFATGCGLFLVECTLSVKDTYKWHLNPRQAVVLIEASGCRRGLLTHISERSEPEIRRMIKSRGRVGVARDLMRLRIV